jgi:hypothetical protein
MRSTKYETPGYEILVIFYFRLSEAQNVKQLEYFSLRTLNTSSKTLFYYPAICQVKSELGTQFYILCWLIMPATQFSDSGR